MMMDPINSLRSSSFMILVILCILTLVEFSQSCHRRVEYHHYYKKHPHKGHGGWGQGGGHGKGHGHHGGGHYGGGHGGGYSGGKGHGHGGGYDHYGGGKGHGHGGGHDHYGGGKGHGHGGGHDHYGGGKGHGHGGGHDHYGGGKGHGHGGGHDHYGGGKGHGHGGGHDHYGHGGGHNQYGGGDGGGYGHVEHGHGNAHGGGYGNGHKSHGKGHRIKYQMYETVRYNDKDGQSHGYSHTNPHYLQKGYGYSGPYPNTEYSNPVEASVNPPVDMSSLVLNSFGGNGASSQLDAADTADLIRTTYDSKENEIMSQPFGTSGGGVGMLMSDSSGGSEPNSAFPTPTMELSESGGGLESKVDPSTGNFDLNLNYNADLPDPFRRNFAGANENNPSGISPRRRKKISSKYRRGPNRSSSEVMMSSQSEQKPQNAKPESTPDSNTATKANSSPEFVNLMNF